MSPTVPYGTEYGINGMVSIEDSNLYGTRRGRIDVIGE